MIDDDTERKGFKSGIQSALNELDMMMPAEIKKQQECLWPEFGCAYLQKFWPEGVKAKEEPMPKETMWEPQMQEKTLVEKGWEYAKMLSDREDQDLFGILVGPDRYKFKVEVWKGDWNSCPPEEEPIELKVTRAMSWKLNDWNNDESGGPGLLFSSVFETPNGKPYTFNVVIPKGDLIKALATLERD